MGGRGAASSRPSDSQGDEALVQLAVAGDVDAALATGEELADLGMAQRLARFIGQQVLLGDIGDVFALGVSRRRDDSRADPWTDAPPPGSPATTPRVVEHRIDVKDDAAERKIRWRTICPMENLAFRAVFMPTLRGRPDKAPISRLKGMAKRRSQTRARSRPGLAVAVDDFPSARRNFRKPEPRRAGMMAAARPGDSADHPGRGAPDRRAGAPMPCSRERDPRAIGALFGTIAIGYGAGLFRLVAADGLAGLEFLAFSVALPALFFHLIAATPAGNLDGWSFIGHHDVRDVLRFALAFSIGALLNGGNVPEATIEGLIGSYSNTAYHAPALVIGAFGATAAAPTALILSFDTAMLFIITPLMMGARRDGTHRSVEACRSDRAAGAAQPGDHGDGARIRRARVRLPSAGGDRRAARVHRTGGGAGGALPARGAAGPAANRCGFRSSCRRSSR